MTFDEAMEKANEPAFVRRDSWAFGGTVRARFDDSTEEYIGLWLEKTDVSSRAQRPYVPYEEDMQATDWRVARADEEPGA